MESISQLPIALIKTLKGGKSSFGSIIDGLHRHGISVKRSMVADGAWRSETSHIMSPRSKEREERRSQGQDTAFKVMSP